MDPKGNALKIIDFPRVKKVCQQCSMTELCLPRGLSPPDLERLEEALPPSRPVARNHRLFRVGTAFEQLYIVRSGSVKLTLSDEHGNEQIVGFYLPGELVGLDGIETGRHTCTATALETSSVCVFPQSRLESACRQIPSLLHQMQRLVGRELNSEARHLLTISKKSAEQRIATFLLSLSGRFARLGYSRVEFHLPMSRQDLGDFLGLAIETVSRILGRFQSAGLLEIDRRLVRILDLPALKRICSGEGEASCRGGS